MSDDEEQKIIVDVQKSLPKPLPKLVPPLTVTRHLKGLITTEDFPGD